MPSAVKQAPRTLRIPVDLDNELVDLAASSGQSVSAVAALALGWYFGEQRAERDQRCAPGQALDYAAGKRSED
jgi:hypothetical protein